MVCAALLNMAVQPPAVCYSDVAGMFAGLFFTMEPFPALRVAPLRKDRENDPFVRQFSASAPPGRSGAFLSGSRTNPGAVTKDPDARNRDQDVYRHEPFPREEGIRGSLRKGVAESKL